MMGGMVLTTVHPPHSSEFLREDRIYADGIAAALADDYAFVHMTGTRQGKRAYIETVCDGTLNPGAISKPPI